MRTIEFFEKGDKVRVVVYGHVLVQSKEQNEIADPSFPILDEDATTRVIDIMPHLIGKEGIVVDVTFRDGGKRVSYILSGIPEKDSWYSHKQLELVK